MPSLRQSARCFTLEETMLRIMNDYGYLGIFFLIFIENVFPPIPSEVVLLFGGAMTVLAGLNAPTVVIVATLGSLAGAVVLYLLGRILKAERLRKLFSGRFGQHPAPQSPRTWTRPRRGSSSMRRRPCSSAAACPSCAA